MSALVHLLSLGMQHPRKMRRRFWVTSGRPIIIGPGITMHVFVDREDDEYRTTAKIQNHAQQGLFDRVQSFRLDAATWIDLSAYCGVMAIPRAFEVDRSERPVRVLMEFVVVGSGIDWMTPA